MSQANKVAKNTAFLYVQMAITVFVSLYTTRLILSSLGIKDFGVFNLVGGAIAMLTFLNTAMASASQRFMSYAQGEGVEIKQKQIFNISLLLHIGVAVVVVIFLYGCSYFLFSGFLNIEPDRIDVAKDVFQFLIISTFFTIISVPYDAVINAHENMLLVAILRIIEVVLKLAIAIYLSFSPYDKLMTYGLLMASLSVVLLIVRQVYCHKKYEEVEIGIKKYYNKPLFREMTSFAGWSFAGSSTSIVANYGQGIVLNIFFGTAINAAQGIAAQVSGQLSAFANVMLRALNPMIAKSEGAGNRSLMLKASLIGSKLGFFLLLIFYVPFLIETKYILKIWLIDIPNFAVIFCQLLLMKGLIEQLFLTLVTSINAVGKIKLFQICQSILTILPLPISYLLFWMEYPPYYLYIVFIVYALFKGGITLYFTKKYCNLSLLHFIRKVIFPCILTFLITYLLSYSTSFIFSQGILRLCISLVVSTISLLMCVWIFGLDEEEKLIFRRLSINISKRVRF
ncbi:MATE family efflux transporter [Gillisia sp. CAL575]|uniref:MATE family efflux transporter n=1 Tax=Gillisia sp. CAL575 TaxID=985255 RepID=UPI00054FDDFA|nr:MATE family efflux transporter [Gillisia sp. CAL575]